MMRTGDASLPLPPRWPAGLPAPEALGFGLHLGPFAVMAEHAVDSGWSAPEVLPRGAGAADLATGGLQYGLSVFEGFKAFRAADGTAQLFRLREHALRLQRSAARLCMPEPPVALFEQLARRAVEVHRDWLPPQGRGALYLRPTLYACEELLGLRRAQRHRLACVVTPCSVPPLHPKRLWAERGMIRAAPGGLGAAKTGANYAASLYGAEAARARGYDDALWLDAREQRRLGEAGTMNVFVVLDDRVLTPALDGTILAGITRDSAMCLLREQGQVVEEAAISLDDLQRWTAQGRLRELFGTGTAARVAPLSELAWDGGGVIPQGGELAAQLAQRLAELQDGAVADRYGWRTAVAL